MHDPSASSRAEQPASFWQLAASVRVRVMLAGALSALGSLAPPAPVIIAIELARAVIAAPGDASGLAGHVWGLIVALVVTVLASQALSTAAYTISHLADADLADDLRQRQITKSMLLRLDWFSRTGSGRVKKLVQDDVAKVHQLIAHVVPDTVNGVVRPVASLALLVVLDWRLGLVALIPLALTAASLPLMMRDMTSRFKRYNRAAAELGAATVELVRGIAPIKVFESGGRGYQRFADSAVEHHRFYMEWMTATVWGSALMLMFTSPGFAVTTAGVGGILLAAFAGMDPVLVLPALLLAANIAGPLFMLMQMRQFMREANGASRDVAAFFALPTAADGDGEQSPAGAGVDLQSVSFAYEGGPLAVDDLSVTLDGGTLTAIVGPSGSGKSTVASLVPRLLDPDTGAVRLGGADVAQLSAKALYRQVAFVFQQPYLLRLSVRDNIRLARPQATDDAVVAAAKAAQIHDRILALPNGYDTMVGTSVRLSGGEQQRLSIARAIVMDAPVLVLDEATAFADPDSEASIQQALATLMQGRTVLVIAHRLHTITGADRILVLAGGRIIEQGTHAELVALGGAYDGMWRLSERGRSRADDAHESRVASR